MSDRDPSGLPPIPVPPSVPPPPPPTLSAPPMWSGGTAPPPPRLARVRGLAKAIVVLQLASVVLSIVVLLTQLSLVEDARDFRDGAIGSAAFRDELATYFGVIGLLALVGVGSLVTLIVWTYRMSANLDGLGRRPRTWRRGWGIVVWLLQGLTVSILPYLMLRELWKGSDPHTPRGDPGWKRSRIGPALHIWFALNLAQVITAFALGVFNFANVNFGRATDSIARSLDERMPFIVAGTVLSAAATMMLLVVVRQLTDRHSRAIGDA